MIMDRTFRVLIAVLAVAVLVPGIIAGISAYTAMLYGNTFKGVYDYECTININSILEDVKIYIPLPSGPAGLSAIGMEAGKERASGMPEDWRTGILGSDDWLMLEITADRIEPAPGGEGITFSISSSGKEEIDTSNPIQFAEVLQPINNPMRIVCSEGIGKESLCYMYTGHIFAGYLAEEDAEVGITVSLSGENSWTIFEEKSNIFTDTQKVTIQGAGKGWYDTEGILNAAIGIYR